MADKYYTEKDLTGKTILELRGILKKIISEFNDTKKAEAKYSALFLQKTADMKAQGIDDSTKKQAGIRAIVLQAVEDLRKEQESTDTGDAWGTPVERVKAPNPPSPPGRRRSFAPPSASVRATSIAIPSSGRTAVFYPDAQMIKGGKTLQVLMADIDPNWVERGKDEGLYDFEVKGEDDKKRGGFVITKIWPNPKNKNAVAFVDYLDLLPMKADTAKSGNPVLRDNLADRGKAVSVTGTKKDELTDNILKALYIYQETGVKPRATKTSTTKSRTAVTQVRRMESKREDVLPARERDRAVPVRVSPPKTTRAKSPVRARASSQSEMFEGFQECGDRLADSGMSLEEIKGLLKDNGVDASKVRTLHQAIALYCQYKNNFENTKTCSSDNNYGCDGGQVCNVNTKPGICVDDDLTYFEPAWVTTADGHQIVGSKPSVDAVAKELSRNRYADTAPVFGKFRYIAELKKNGKYKPEHLLASISELRKALGDKSPPPQEWYGDFDLADAKEMKGRKEVMDAIRGRKMYAGLHKAGFASRKENIAKLQEALGVDEEYLKDWTPAEIQQRIQGLDDFKEVIFARRDAREERMKALRQAEEERKRAKNEDEDVMGALLGGDVEKPTDPDDVMGALLGGGDAVKPRASSLPPNWEKYKDDEYGDYYYYNSGTGVTTWDRPGKIPTPPPKRPESIQVIVAESRPIRATVRDSERKEVIPVDDSKKSTRKIERTVTGLEDEINLDEIPKDTRAIISGLIGSDADGDSGAIAKSLLDCLQISA